MGLGKSRPSSPYTRSEFTCFRASTRAAGPGKKEFGCQAPQGSGLEGQGGGEAEGGEDDPLKQDKVLLTK